MPGKRLIDTVDGVGAVSNALYIAGLLDNVISDTLNLKLLALSHPGGLARYLRGYCAKFVPLVIGGVPLA